MRRHRESPDFVESGCVVVCSRAKVPRWTCIRDNWTSPSTRCVLLSANSLRALDTCGRHFDGAGRGGDLTLHDEWLSTPGNILVEGGRLVGIIDVGGLGPADPALDLVCAWHLFDAPARAVLREALRCSDVEWERGRVWAFQQAMGLVWYYERSNPSMSALGRRTLERIVAE